MKSFRIPAILLIILVSFSCEDFLDLRPEGTTPTTGTDYTKAENIFLPISASYAKLRSYGAHVFPYIGAFEIASDNADKGSAPEDNPTMKELDDLKYGPTNGLLNDLWSGYFDIVSGANFAIHEMPKFEEALLNTTDKDYAMQCQGEAKTIRAYAYFNLTRLFGRVPIIDTTLSAEQLAATHQSSTKELYKFIEKDLEEAIAVLPDFYSKEWAGRINKYTAMAIKAKVHLYQAEWDSVASLTDKIIASGRYGLLPKFREIFSVDKENSEESLFEIQSSTLGSSTGPSTYLEYAYVQGPRGNTPSNMQGWGFCTPSQNLIDFFNSRNEVIRPATTLLYRGTLTPEGDSIKKACTNPVYNGKVYTPSYQNKWNFNGYGFDLNIRILRYSDVLLMHAEALVNGAAVPLTSGTTANGAVNMVRERAGLTGISGVTLQNIWDERRAELAMEQDRFFDLIRTNQAATALANKGFITGKHEVYPIPAAQIQLNTNLTQNNGYN
ncbi:MAG: RagB/SusD family nutrient uptake outer membrane protein [Bacteroidales bacterium]|nr:RagB/SusD family nutrient uptake outer membrane protein [Tenuifilaceae bacterium]